jgi:hypothetical protein
MDADVEAVITPVEVKIENEDQKVELGSEAREALRIEQVAALREALDAIGEYAEMPLDELIRAQHEDLHRWLSEAQKASGAIWWLIPPDVYTAGEDD